VHRPLHDVTDFSVIGPYKLRITFDDGLSREIDFWPALAGELFLPLRDLEFFNSVRLDPEVGNLVWPNGADFDPSELHDWPEVEEAWAEWARRWWADRASEAD
jgi:hypothetical protein